MSCFNVNTCSYNGIKNGKTCSGRISFVDVDVAFADGDIDLGFAGRAGNLRSDVEVVLSLFCLRFTVMGMVILSW